MSAGIRTSLFDPPGSSPLVDAMAWITDTIMGSAATTLCVIAVAVLGLTMLTGRLPVRRGLEVVLGCFVLFGAPVIAGAFINAAQSEASAPAPPPPPAPPARADLPPASADPYAGAALRVQ